MKTLKTALFFLPLLAALGFGLVHLARRSGPATDDWDAMQRAVDRAEDERPGQEAVELPETPASQPLQRSEDPVDPPGAPPPGGPFAEDGRDTLPELGGPGYDYRLMAWVDERVARDDIDAVHLAGQLRASPLPSERVAGAVLLADLGVLGADAVVELAADDEPTVPLNVLGWLCDAGDEAAAEILRDALVAEGYTTDELKDLVSEPALSAAGRRALIELAAGSGGDAAELSAWLLAASASADQPLDVRAKATVELRGVAEPDDIATRLTASGPMAIDTKPVAGGDGEAPDIPRTASGDQAWGQLRERLARDLVAPPGLAELGGEVRLADLEEWTASGSVLIQLLEVTSRLEYALRVPDARVEPGVADAVSEYLEDMESGQPLPPDLQLAVRRIRNHLPLLSAVESASPAHALSYDGPPK